MGWRAVPLPPFTGRQVTITLAPFRCRTSLTMVEILYADNDPAEIATFRRLFGKRFKVTSALVERPSTACRAITTELAGRVPDLLVLDLHLNEAETILRKLPPRAEEDVQQRIARIVANASALPAFFCNAGQLLREAQTVVDESRFLVSALLLRLSQGSAAGIRLLQELQSLYPRTPAVFYSRKVSLLEFRQGIEAGAVDVLQKPAFAVESRRARELGDQFCQYANGRKVWQLART